MTLTGVSKPNLNGDSSLEIALAFNTEVNPSKAARHLIFRDKKGRIVKANTRFLPHDYPMTVSAPRLPWEAMFSDAHKQENSGNVPNRTRILITPEKPLPTGVEWWLVVAKLAPILTESIKSIKHISFFIIVVIEKQKNITNISFSINFVFSIVFKISKPINRNKFSFMPSFFSFLKKFVSRNK